MNVSSMTKNKVKGSSYLLFVGVNLIQALQIQLHIERTQIRPLEQSPYSVGC